MLIKSLIPLLASCSLVMSTPAWTHHGTAPGYENGIIGNPPEVSPKGVAVMVDDTKPLKDFLPTRNAAPKRPFSSSKGKTIDITMYIGKDYPRVPAECTPGLYYPCRIRYIMEEPVITEQSTVTVSSEMCVASNNPGLNQITSSMSRTLSHEWTYGIGVEIKGIVSASIAKTYAESATTEKSYSFQVNPGDRAVIRFTPKFYHVKGTFQYYDFVGDGRVVGSHRADFLAPVKDSNGHAYGTYWLNVLSSGNSCGGGQGSGGQGDGGQGGGGQGGGGHGSGFPAACNGLNTNEYGKGKGRGRTGYCCKDSDDCKSSCRKSQCNK